MMDNGLITVKQGEKEFSFTTIDDTRRFFTLLQRKTRPYRSSLKDRFGKWLQGLPVIGLIYEMLTGQSSWVTAQIHYTNGNIATKKLLVIDGDALHDPDLGEDYQIRAKPLLHETRGLVFYVDQYLGMTVNPWAQKMFPADKDFLIQAATNGHSLAPEALTVGKGIEDTSVMVVRNDPKRRAQERRNWWFKAVSERDFPNALKMMWAGVGIVLVIVLEILVVTAVQFLR